MKRLFVEAPLPFEEARQWATDDELTTACSFTAARGREYLAWRAIVRREIGRDATIAYDAIGAPILTNYPYHITVSHCQDRVAVGISDRPCAIDIERTDRNFQRILSRYLTPEEQRLSAHPLYPAIAWCSKESMYKYAGRRELDLLCDLRIDNILFPEETGSDISFELPENLPVDIHCGRLSVHYTKTERPFHLYFYQKQEYVIAFRFD